MGVFTSIAAGVGAAASAGSSIAGALGGSKEQQQQRLLLDPASRAEKQAGNLSQAQLQQLRDLVGQGPGAQDVQAGLSAQRGFADQLRQFAQTGSLGADFQQGAQRGAAAQLAPQRAALQASFEAQRQNTAQLAAQLGRPVDDPILQAKLATSQIQQEMQLAGQETALAQQIQGQQLAALGQATDIRAQLGQQALQNRLTLFGAGQQALGAERNFRLGAAGGQTTISTPGAGTFGAIGSGLAGATAGLTVGQEFGSDLQNIFGRKSSGVGNHAGGSNFGANLA